MPAELGSLIFVFLSFAALILYDLRAFSFSASILELRPNHRLAKLFSILTNCVLLALIFAMGLPMLLSYLIVYLAVLLELCMIFRGQAVLLLFGSGNFLFHLMDVQMIVAALYVLLFDIPTPEEFFRRYPSSVFLTLLLVTALLEVFRRGVDQAALRLLLKNNGQLLFATTSMSLINIYLLILSVSYGGQAYSALAAVFLLCTGVLLFGAFYTAFQHALRMSVLLEYKAKSHTLEQKLEQSQEDLDAMQEAASTDALTAVHNRRYGLAALDRQLAAGEPGCVCFVDIDQLKSVNDQYGHDEGDQYILRVVRALAEVLSSQDTLARLGGDEFLLILPGRTETEAEPLLERVREKLNTSATCYRSSISYGILALRAEDRLSVSEALRRADAKMYEDKLARREEG